MPFRGATEAFVQSECAGVRARAASSEQHGHPPPLGVQPADRFGSRSCPAHADTWGFLSVGRERRTVLRRVFPPGPEGSGRDF